MVTPNSTPPPAGVTPVNPKQLREDAGLPRIHMAARVPCSEITLRMYECDPNGISPRMRKKVDAAYAELARNPRPYT